MNPLLTDITGLDEFVITPKPNTYLVGLRLTEDQAKEFDGSERISIAMDILEDGKAGVRYVRDVTAENNPGEKIFPATPEGDFTDGQIEVLRATEDHLHDMITAFLEEVGDDLDEYFRKVLPMRQLMAALDA